MIIFTVYTTITQDDLNPLSIESQYYASKVLKCANSLTQ